MVLPRFLSCLTRNANDHARDLSGLFAELWLVVPVLGVGAHSHFT